MPRTKGTKWVEHWLSGVTSGPSSSDIGEKVACFLHLERSGEKNTLENELLAMSGYYIMPKLVISKKRQKSTKKTSRVGRPLVNVVQNNSRERRVSRVASRPMLTPIGMKYLAASTMPHDMVSQMAYIPDISARPSLKASGRGRAVITIPASSKAMLFVQPTTCNDNGGIFTVSGTNTNFGNANALYQFVTAPPGLVYNRINFAGLPFALSALASGRISARCVSAGIKVKYTGNVLSRGGTAIWCENTGFGGESLLTDAEATTLTLSLYEARIQGLLQTRFCNFNENSEHEFVVNPPLNVEPAPTGLSNITDRSGWVQYGPDTVATGYQTSWFGQTGAAKVFGNAANNWSSILGQNVLILNNSSAANPIEFTIEYVTHVEYSGGSVVPLQSPSPTAIEDVYKVHTALSASKHSHSTTPEMHPAAHTQSVLMRMEGEARKVVHSGIEAAFRMISKPKNAERIATGMANLFL